MDNITRGVVRVKILRGTSLEHLNFYNIIPLENQAATKSMTVNLYTILSKLHKIFSRPNAQGRTILELGDAIMDAFHEYIGDEYSLPKLDQITTSS